MNYIKMFEDFNLPEKVDFTSQDLGNLIIYYFNIDDYKFRVSFKLDEDDDITWERTYKVTNYGKGYQTFNSKDNMAKKIVSAVTYITNEFIIKYKPYIIYIHHILMEYKDVNGKVFKHEKIVSNKLNKRARINYEYFKTLNCIKNGEYIIRYFNVIQSVFGYTSCYIYKKELENEVVHLFPNLNEVKP